MHAPSHLLSLLIWLPILGAVAVLAFGRNANAARWLALLVALVDVRRLDSALDRLPAAAARHAVRREPRLDSGAQGQLRARRRRHLDRADRADRVHDRAGRDRLVGSDRGARRAVHGRDARARRPADRRVRGDRCAAVLRVLRRHADSDVHHHRHLGRPAARLCDAEVLHLHVPRLDLHAGRADLPAHEDRRFLAGVVRARGPRHARAGLAVLRVPDRLRDQGADVAGAHLVAGCARRGADRRLGRCWPRSC